jgi:hypothetical protein
MNSATPKRRRRTHHAARIAIPSVGPEIKTADLVRRLDKLEAAGQGDCEEAAQITRELFARIRARAYR